MSDEIDAAESGPMAKPLDLDRLYATVLAARMCWPDADAVQEFYRTVTPDAVLALLERVKAAEPQSHALKKPSEFFLRGGWVDYAGNWHDDEETA